MPEWIMQLMLTLGAAVGVYTGIRADLARLHERVEAAHRESIRANTRIDAMLSSMG